MRTHVPLITRLILRMLINSWWVLWEFSCSCKKGVLFKVAPSTQRVQSVAERANFVRVRTVFAIILCYTISLLHINICNVVLKRVNSASKHA